MKGSKVRLILAASLLVGWLGWLSYTAVKKSRSPIVSRAQAAAATNPVLAEVRADDANPSPNVKVLASLTPAGPAENVDIAVRNMRDVRGYEGPGQYLLLLTKTGKDEYSIAGQQRSPGYDLSGTGKPAIYRWTPDVKAQAERLWAK